MTKIRINRSSKHELTPQLYTDRDITYRTFL